MPSFEKKNTLNTKWNLKLLFTIYFLVAFFIFTLFCEATQGFWVPLDTGCFRMLNSWIAESTFSQNLWAIANHRMTDWFEDFVFLLFFTWIIKATPKEVRIRKIAECIFILFFSALVHLAINETLFRGLLHVQRKSPTLILDSFVDLSEKISWIKVKVRSPKSYPGDHATVAILFMAGFLYLARKNFKITCLSFLYGITLILPRLVVGAHWLTDVLFGSVFIVLVPFSLAFCSPLAFFTIQKIENKIHSTLAWIKLKKRIALR